MSVIEFGGGGRVGPRYSITDYNDAATAITPIALTTPGTYYPLTNDGLGPFTNKTFVATGYGDIWNVSTNQFDWSALKLGDTVDYRLDVSITTGSPNTEVTSRIELAIGSGADYNLGIDLRQFKTAKTYPSVIRWNSVYMGDTDTLNYPARFAMAADTAGTTVVVNGWYVRVNIT